MASSAARFFLSHSRVRPHGWLLLKEQSVVDAPDGPVTGCGSVSYCSGQTWRVCLHVLRLNTGNKLWNSDLLLWVNKSTCGTLVIFSSLVIFTGRSHVVGQLPDSLQLSLSCSLPFFVFIFANWWKQRESKQGATAQRDQRKSQRTRWGTGSSPNIPARWLHVTSIQQKRREMKRRAQTGSHLWGCRKRSD